jgi:hypothetical protein
MATLLRLKTAFGKLFGTPSSSTVARSLNNQKALQEILFEGRNIFWRRAAFFSLCHLDNLDRARERLRAGGRSYANKE